MKRYSFYFGTELDKDNKPVEDGQIAISLIQKLACELFGGFTQSQTIGGWLNPKTDNVVKERSLKIEVLTDDPDGKTKAEVFSKYINVQLNQSLVIVAEEDIKYWGV